jgi:hypothetical protein
MTSHLLPAFTCGPTIHYVLRRDRADRKIVLYSKKVGYYPDYTSLLQRIMHVNPENGAEFATQFAHDESVCW